MENKERQTVCISGITGQDGSYLCDYYLGRGDKVIGLKRRSSTDNEWRLKMAKKSNLLTLEECDITDSSGVNNIIAEYQPDVLLNTCAMSHVHTSFSNPKSTIEINTLGVLNCLEAIRNLSPSTRFVQCGTSEQYGKNYDTDKYGRKVQNEKTVFDARSPYAVSKIAAYQLVTLYRDAYNLFACNALSYNHGSPRRGDNFIEMKIGKWIREHAKIFKESHTIGGNNIYTTYNSYKKLALGNLNTYRDFSDSRDIVRGLVKIAEHDQPDDFVLCSGRTIQIRDLVEKMFGLVGVKNWEKYIYIDPKFFRPAEVDYLKGDCTKAREILGWEPEISLDEMCEDIVFYNE